MTFANAKVQNVTTSQGFLTLKLQVIKVNMVTSYEFLNVHR